jgi:type III restriction enzyme/adenine-specific DNA-methyltransferase
MIKNTLVANEKVTLNDSKVTLLKENFPGCFTRDGEFDIEKFRQIMVDNFTVINEGYGLQFLGKTYARYVSQLETETVIQPDVAHNKKSGNATSENIYISGDNIDALKHMLQSYEKSVKCIYIDPPYNTGSDDFAYTDDFKLTQEILQEKLSLTKEQAERVLDLTTRNSSSHSAWLMFMYPRLILARGLLKEDGVIFISIDDNEQTNLKLICDEVFGEENFVGNFIWRKKEGGGQTKEAFVIEHEYILVYSRQKNFTWIEQIEKRNKSEFNKKDQSGIFKTTKLAKWGNSARKEDRESMYFPLLAPDKKKIYPIAPDGNPGRWRVGKERMNEIITNKLLYWEEKNGKWIPYEKEYFNDQDKILKERSILYDIGNTGDGTDELTDLFGRKDLFANPKPVELVECFINHTSISDDVILDFFSGSATTAHAVMQMNVKDEADGKEGKRKYILVQLPEVVKSNSEAEKAGFKTICDIGMARIEKAAEKIRNEYPETKVDLGFKHFTLEHLSQKTITELEHFDPNEQTLTADNSMLKKFGTPTVLATWLVRDSYGFTAVPQKLQLDSYEAYTCGHHLYLIDSDFSDKALVALCKKYEEDSSFVFTHVVVFGYSFTMTMLSALKANLQSYKDSEKNLNITFDVRY